MVAFHDTFAIWRDACKMSSLPVRPNVGAEAAALSSSSRERSVMRRCLYRQRSKSVAQLSVNDALVTSADHAFSPKRKEQERRRGEESDGHFGCSFGSAAGMTGHQACFLQPFVAVTFFA